MSKDRIQGRKADRITTADSAGTPETARPVIALQPAEVARLARRERVSEAEVKAAMLAFGTDRAKVVASLRSRKVTLH